MRTLSITRMHSSRMRTARSSSRREGLPQCMLGYTPWEWACRPPRVRAWKPSPGVGLEPPPQYGPGDPPGCEPGDPSQARPLNFPLWCRPGDPPLARPLNFPPGCGPGNLQGMLGYHLQCMLRYHPPVNRILDTHY